MIGFLREWIVGIVTLVIFLLLIEIIVPSGKTKKFVNLISGFVLMIALINPFLKFSKMDIDLKSFQFSQSNYINKKDIEQKSKVMNDKQMKQISAVYRENIIRQLEDGVKGVKGISDVKADVIINEDYKSQAFGEVKRVYLSIKPEESKDKVKPVKKVKKVSIGDDVKPKEDADKINSKLKGQIEEIVTRFLGVEKENIVILVRRVRMIDETV
jgi:stage III sporulation protein AF